MLDVLAAVAVAASDEDERSALLAEIAQLRARAVKAEGEVAQLCDWAQSVPFQDAPLPSGLVPPSLFPYPPPVGSKKCSSPAAFGDLHSEFRPFIASLTSALPTAASSPPQSASCAPAPPPVRTFQTPAAPPGTPTQEVASYDALAGYRTQRERPFDPFGHEVGSTSTYTSSSIDSGSGCFSIGSSGSTGASGSKQPPLRRRLSTPVPQVKPVPQVEPVLSLVPPTPPSRLVVSPSMLGAADKAAALLSELPCCNDAVPRECKAAALSEKWRQDDVENAALKANLKAVAARTAAGLCSCECCMEGSGVPPFMQIEFSRLVVLTRARVEPVLQADLQLYRLVGRPMRPESRCPGQRVRV